MMTVRMARSVGSLYTLGSYNVRYKHSWVSQRPSGIRSEKLKR
jgi:hypothetical protein